MIVGMAKLRIVGPLTLLEEVTGHLQEFGEVHLEPLPVQPQKFSAFVRFSLDPAHRKKKNEMENLRKELNHLTVSLPDVGEAEPRSVERQLLIDRSDGWIQEAQTVIEFLRPQVEKVLEQVRESDEEQSLLFKYERVLEVLEPLLHQIKENLELDFIGLVLQAEDEAPVQGIRKTLSELTAGRYELFFSRADPKTVAGLLVIPAELSGKIRASLWQENISELKLPSSLINQPVGQALKILLRRRVELPRRLRELRASLCRLSLQWRERLVEFERRVENQLGRMESAFSFYQTQTAFLVYGWVPQKRVSLIVRRLSERFSERVVAERLAIPKEEFRNVPVALGNPPLVRPFEIFVRLVALPRYGSIDPTPYLAFFFPLFYGVILGDIGYGGLLLVCSLYGRKRWGNKPFIKDISFVFILSSLSAILFGVFYGEFFGELGKPIGIHPLLINRMEGFIPLIQAALGIGLFQVFLGMVLGLITTLRYRERRESMIKGCSMIFFVSVLVTLAGASGRLSSAFTLAGGMTSGIMLVSIFVLGGARSSMELHNLVNVLSYLRLMGIGVASAALAFAANTLGRLAGNIVVGIAVGFLLHLINFLFGVFAPMIQSLRLHYVEFFENFFQPGGREYRPFKKL
ncbi:MAG: V-type ATP synthase subunit I [Nitrospiria bacterium]